MTYFLGLFVLGIVCQNALARGLENPVLNDFERRLVRLEARQFSESEDLEHRMLQLETKLGTKKGEETLEQQVNFYAISKVEKVKPAEGLTCLKSLEKVEKNWEKELEEQLAKFSSKYENLSERFSAIEKHVEEHKTSGLNQGKAKGYIEEEKPSNQFQRIGTKYYFIENNYSERTIWNWAVQKCQEMNAHLVSLQNEEEWNALKEVLQPNHNYWIDINDIYYHDKFMSKTTGKIAPFIRWAENEPNSAGGAEDCLEMRADRDFKMNDAVCYDLNYYICESNIKYGL